MDFWTRHITDEVLTDYAAGNVPDVRLRNDIQRHANECRRCTQQLTTLSKIFRLMQTDTARDAAPEMLVWAKNAFLTRRAVQRTPETSANSLTETLKAVLRLELSPFSPAFGERSGPGLERQMLYHAGHYELDLRLTPHGTQWQVAGQVLGPCDAGGVTLQGTGATVETALNPLAEFVLPVVPTGSYKLLVNCGGLLLEVPELALN